MSEHEQQEQPETEGDSAIGDLDVSTEDADQVTGGRAGDPCDGGELPAP